jgi:hypothetical protein
MSLMTEALERISLYCHLTKSDRTREAVERQLSFFPFKLSDEVYEFYQWAGAPTGDRFPEGWDGLHNNNSTYSFVLEKFLGGASDLIHFQSLEEAREHYSNYLTNADLYDIKCLPFIAYENGELVIAGSESQIEVSQVLQREGNNDKLWFPSLTNMMLAIAESLETIGTMMPGFTRDENGDRPNEDEEQEQWKSLTAIAKKYGSPRGEILTN